VSGRQDVVLDTGSSLDVYSSYDDLFVLSVRHLALCRTEVLQCAYTPWAIKMVPLLFLR